MAPGHPCLLWRSGRDSPGVHALGVLTGEPRDGEVPGRLTHLGEPVPRAELVADPVFGEAEVIRMPAGSNPSWLSAAQYAVVLARTRSHPPGTMRGGPRTGSASERCSGC